MWETLAQIAGAILSNNRRGQQSNPSTGMPGADNLGHLGSSPFQLPTQQGQARNNLSGIFGTIKNIFGGDNG